jgi:hypothetical protein
LPTPDPGSRCKHVIAGRRAEWRIALAGNRIHATKSEVQVMPDYRRYRGSVGRSFLTVNLLEQRSRLVRSCASVSCQPHLMMCSDRYENPPPACVEMNLMCTTGSEVKLSVGELG